MEVWRFKTAQTWLMLPQLHVDKQIHYCYWLLRIKHGFIEALYPLESVCDPRGSVILIVSAALRRLEKLWKRMKDLFMWVAVCIPGWKRIYLIFQWLKWKWMTPKQSIQTFFQIHFFQYKTYPLTTFVKCSSNIGVSKGRPRGPLVSLRMS